MSSECFVDRDHGVVVINDSGVETSQVLDTIGQSVAPELAAISRWTTTTHAPSRSGGMFERDRYVTPGNIYDQFRTAHDAAESDDIVSGVIEMTESLAFNRISFRCEDPDQENIWDQFAEDIDLDSRVREMWREMFKVSQFYALNWWGVKNYRVSGRTPAGVQRKKTFNGLRMPIGITMLDPLKVMPVGNLMFNQEKLAYIADWAELDEFDRAAAGDPDADPIAKEIVLGRYIPNDMERRQLSNYGAAYDRMFLLDPRKVWRHTDTRSQYERFASVRMKSVFELLDLKHQLRMMDRVHLIGSTNYIVLVTKGSDTLPANQKEIASLQSQVRMVAQVPIIVGDHRLKVEIITPKTDTTLSLEKHSMLDQRIAARLFGMFMTGGATSGGKSDDSVKIAKLVAKGLQSRRHMLVRAVERNIIKPAMQANPELTDMPKMRVHPTRIDLEFDAATVQFLLDLRDRGDLSRDSILNEMDFDQEDEAMMRKREAELFDDDFAPVAVPFSAPPGDGAKPKAKPKAAGPNDPANPASPAAKRAAGRRGGGLKSGGGAAPGSGQGQPPRRGRPKDPEKPGRA